MAQRQGIGRGPGFGLTWSVAGALLCAPLVSSYAASGPLSRTTGLAGVRILRDTGLDAVLPRGAAYVLLAMPVAGLMMLATAAWRLGAWWRGAELALASLAGGLVVMGLGLFDPRGWGAALWSCALGIVLAAVALVVSSRSARVEERNPA